MLKPLFTPQPADEKQSANRLPQALSILLLLLTTIVAAIPGVLHIMHRADAQVALGNAKSLRMALDATATVHYGSNQPFCDTSSIGGVTEEVWRQVITDSKVPGDFWILQMDKNGYEVQRFYYQEGDFTVTFCRKPLTYEVFYQQEIIQTDKPSVIKGE